MAHDTSGDVRVLRALAHPVRTRILGELGAAGPLRAADIATRIDVPANQASFHLRQLAKYGLVEPAPELARDGRDRVWRLAEEEGTRLHLDVLEKDPDNQAAVGVFRREMSRQVTQLVELAFRKGAEQQDDTTVTVINDAIALTKAEAREYAEELAAVNDRWRRRTREGDVSGRRTYSVVHVVQPYPKQEG
jgi:DNA-binding transcriptional ArsR family regulator